jgi:hypothetical protein
MRATAHTSDSNKNALPRDGVIYHVIAYLRVSIDDDITGSHTIQTQRDCQVAHGPYQLFAL